MDRKLSKNKILYSINVADVQTVAQELIERKLTDEEVLMVSDKIGDHIAWFDAIWYAMQDTQVRNA
jgi:hypothetical protein